MAYGRPTSQSFGHMLGRLHRQGPFTMHVRRCGCPASCIRYILHYKCARVEMVWHGPIQTQTHCSKPVKHVDEYTLHSKAIHTALLYERSRRSGSVWNRVATSLILYLGRQVIPLIFSRECQHWSGTCVPDNAVKWLPGDPGSTGKRV